MASNQQDPNARQVGGDHYARGGEFQHWDFTIEFLKNRYLEGAITKYVWRHRFKGIAEQDLEKASHFTDKLIDAAKRGTVQPMRCPEREDFMFHESFVMHVFDGNALESVERRITVDLMNWRSVDDLQSAKSGIATLLEAVYVDQRRSDAVKAGGEPPRLDPAYIAELEAAKPHDLKKWLHGEWDIGDAAKNGAGDDPSYKGAGDNLTFRGMAVSVDSSMPVSDELRGEFGGLGHKGGR